MWNVEGSLARWDEPPQDWRIDLRRPEAGVASSRLAAWLGPEGEGRLLALLLPGAELTDVVARGAELIAQYDQHDEAGRSPASVELVWRVLAARDEAPGVELLLSVATSQLLCRPALQAVARVRADELVRLRGDQQERGPADGMQAPVPLGGGSAPSAAWLVRRRRSDESLALLADPRDVTAAEASLASGAASLTLTLFDEPLEKGVIRRARIRLLRLPAAGDDAAARAAYGQLLAAPPPLSA